MNIELSENKPQARKTAASQPDGERKAGLTRVELAWLSGRRPESLSEARDTLKKRESEIAKDAKLSFRYAKLIVKGRFPAGEKAVLGSISTAFMYAREIIGGRWPKLERFIIGTEDAYAAYHYAAAILGGRWPEAEPFIAKSHTAIDYIMDVVRSRWPEGEAGVLKSAEGILAYATRVINSDPNTPVRRWVKGEKALLAKGDVPVILEYIDKVVRGPWEEAEVLIMAAGDDVWDFYVSRFHSPDAALCSRRG